MVRKLASIVVVFALLLGGFYAAPAARPALAAAPVELQAPCCADCDQQSLPDEPGCRVTATCMTGPAEVAPMASAVPVFYPRLLNQPLLHQFSAPAVDVSPPFRPPRTSILV